MRQASEMTERISGGGYKGDVHSVQRRVARGRQRIRLTPSQFHRYLGDRDKPGIEIVGKIANGRTDDLTQKASPEVCLPLWQAQAFSKHLVVRTAADPRAFIVDVERALRSVNPTAAIENVKTLEQIRDDSLASRTFAMNLLAGFSTVASVLTLVGIYGVLSLPVASRRRELASAVLSARNRKTLAD